MLKILHTESSLGWGGQEIRIIREILGLKQRGYWIALAAPQRSNIYKRASKEDILVFPLDLHKRHPFISYQLASIIKKNNIQILNSHSSRDSWHSVFVKSFFCKNLRLIRTRHLSTPISKNIFSKFLYKTPDVIITTGESIRQRMIEINKFDAQKIISIPTGVDINLFSYRGIIPSLNKEKDHIYIGTISILRSWKGLDYFIYAIKILVKSYKNLKFFITGDGPQKGNLINLAQKIGVDKYIEFLGYREDIPGILASLDILVHPSTGHEGVPQIILQALAMKKPVIATNVGSIPEIIKNQKTGLLIKPRSPQEIAKAISFLIEDKNIAKELGEKGRLFVEDNYSLERMLEKIENIYHKII